MTLKHARTGRQYVIQKIDLGDGEFERFLFALGFFNGEKICVVSHLKGGCIVAVRGSRYCIDNHLAEGIIV